MRRLIVGLMGLTLTAGVFAQTPQPSGDKSTERRLQRALQAEPDDHVALAQLARLYADTGRKTKAERLYRGLLSLDEVVLEGRGGATASSHLVARAALARLREPAAIRLGSR